MANRGTGNATNSPAKPIYSEVQSNAQLESQGCETRYSRHKSRNETSARCQRRRAAAVGYESALLERVTSALAQLARGVRRSLFHTYKTCPNMPFGKIPWYFYLGVHP